MVYGESRNRTAAQSLARAIEEVISEGTLYLAYPVLSTADERVEVDALLVSADHGLVAILLNDSRPATADEWASVTAAQDRLFAVLEGHLRRHEGLRSGRQLALAPETATVFSTPVVAPAGAEGFYGDLDQLTEFIARLPGLTPEVERHLEAALQRVSTIKPAKKRAGVEKTSSRGAKMKEIERGIANLDRWQKAAAIESPEGPQRIRGLAGSGKTVVLALKAAYWHGQHPEWLIAVTFHTRALYQQISDLTTRFSFEHSNDRPDPERLRIMHSWGSRSDVGVYSTIAVALGETPRDWSYARGKYGMDDAFQGVCRELLESAQRQTVEPIFDAVLIDEAQDLPPEFFQLVYMLTKDPKRIVWGYDELQRLSEAAMPTTDELFGTRTDGQSLVSVTNPEHGARRDIVLPVCYRNTPWALATAHALGSGIYRPDGLVQHPDEPSLWNDIGYDVRHGRLEPGQPVTLERRKDSGPEYFDRLLTAEDSVSIHAFDDEEAQDRWVAQQIHTNLTHDELEEDDILIVLQDTYRAKSRAPRLMRELRRLSIDSHLVGVNSSVDEVFVPGSVAIAHIYRAKGNEAPMVYALDAHLAAAEFNALSKRNKLFTAITRSRAWVRVTGYGESMQAISDEARTVAEKNYRLEFTVPTHEELSVLRHRHRDRSDEDVAVVRKATQGLAAFLEAVDDGDLDMQDLPPELRTRLVRFRAEQDHDNA